MTSAHVRSRLQMLRCIAAHRRLGGDETRDGRECRRSRPPRPCASPRSARSGARTSGERLAPLCGPLRAGEARRHVGGQGRQRRGVRGAAPDRACGHPRRFAAGSATAVAGSTRFAGPALALRPWRVTRRRRRRRGWPWPEARFRPLLTRRDRGAIREPRPVRSWCCVPTGAIGHRRAGDRGEGSGAARRAKRPAGQPRAGSLAAFEPSLHFVDVVQYPAFSTMRNRASNSLTTGTFRLDLSA